jgi:hypothetical protein
VPGRLRQNNDDGIVAVWLPVFSHANTRYKVGGKRMGVDPARMSEAIRAVGVEYVTLSSDAGEPLFPDSAECMRLVSSYMAAFGREMLDRTRWFEIRFDREWVELFSDCPAAPETIAAARHVALGAMRGLALSLSYSVDRSGAKAEVAQLESMLVRTLEGDGKKPLRKAKAPG